MNSKRTKTKSKRSTTARQRTKTTSPPQSTSPGAIGQLIRHLGSLGGGALGTLVGAPTLGATAGSSLGAALSKWLGAGDYTVSSNSLVTRAAQNIPMMHQQNQSVVVRHREYLGPVLSSTLPFAVQTAYPINPGLQLTFPWLHSLADGFQQYSIKGMVYHYVPTSGAISSTQALGSVMIQTSYRANDNPPTSKVEMLNEYCANETVPSDAMCHPIECDPKENPFNVHYVRSGAIPSGEVAMYDIGTTYIATGGQSASGTVLGDLWVTYEIEFKKPMVSSNVTAQGDFYGGYFPAPNSNAILFGAPDQQPRYLSKIGGLEVITLNNIVALPKGVTGLVIVIARISGTLGNSNWTGAPTPANCVLSSIDSSNTYWAQATTNTAADSLCYVVGLNITDPHKSASVTLPTPTTANLPSNVSLVVFSVEQ